MLPENFFEYIKSIVLNGQIIDQNLGFVVIISVFCGILICVGILKITHIK